MGFDAVRLSLAACCQRNWGDDFIHVRLEKLFHYFCGNINNVYLYYCLGTSMEIYGKYEIRFYPDTPR
jgi:hypothetical protein